MARAIRIANCSGFYGDRTTALAEVAVEPDIDVITGDYLAEVTMLVLAKNRAKDATAGYAASFAPQLAPALSTIAERRIKVVTNAGGLNPAGLADRLRTMIAEAGFDLSVAVVTGDDVTARLGELAAAGHALDHLRTGSPLVSWPHTPLTANAYLGGWGIAAALQGGADVVVTGRVTDASVVVGAAAWWHGWQRDDFDALAGAVVAGHLIECGTQVTGGNYSGFTTLGPPSSLGRPSFPIAEIEADGTSVVTKAAGGGAVTVGTVTAQLLYEIGAPAYLNPDVTSHFDTLRLEQAGLDRVRVSGTRGSPPSPTTKVAITAVGGHRNSFTTIVTGLDVGAKVAWFTEAVRAALADVPGIDQISFERIGTAAIDAPDQGAASTMVRTVVTGSADAVGRPFGAAIVELALANFPGFYGLSLPGQAATFGTYWPGLLRQDVLDHVVTHADGRVEHIDPPTQTVAPAPPAGSESVTAGDAVAEGGERAPAGVPIVLGEIVDARSGDKGGDANVGLWVRDPVHWPWLRDHLDVAWIRSVMPEAAGLDVVRYELPNLGAVNFVVHDLLGEGATANLRADNQAKALGEYLRSRRIAGPA